MKIAFTTTYDKKLKYKIFEPCGKKRKLLAKGKFLHSAETEVNTTSGNIIVRVQRYNILVAFLTAVCVGITNFFWMPPYSYMPMKKYLSLFPFEEISVVKIEGGDCVQISYNKAPLKQTVFYVDSSKNKIVDYLTSTSHPYNNEYAGRKPVNIALYILSTIFWVGLIVGICLLVRFLVVDR